MQFLLSFFCWFFCFCFCFFCLAQCTFYLKVMSLENVLHLEGVWIVFPPQCLCFSFFSFFSFFFLCALRSSFQQESGLLVGPVHYSQDPQTSLFSNFFIKNRSHGTIYTFKKIILLQCFQFSAK